MSLWRRVFSAGSPAAGDDSTPRLRALRTRRMNRAYRAFHGILADAAEKLGEGYILDRRYVISFAERAFHQAYEILYHAGVICQDCAIEALGAVDDARARIRTLQTRPDTPPQPRLVLRLSEINDTTRTSVGEGVRCYARLRDRLALPSAEGFVVTAAGVRHLLEAQAEGVGYASLPEQIDGALRSAIAALLANRPADARMVVRVTAEEGSDVDLDSLDLVAECAGSNLLESMLFLLTEAAEGPFPGDRPAREVLSHAVLVVMALPSLTARGSLFTVDPDSPFSGRMRVEVDSPDGGEITWLSRRRAFAVVTSRRAGGEAAARPELLAEETLRELGRMALQVERVCVGSQEVEWVRGPEGPVMPIWTRPLALPAGTEVAPDSLAEARRSANVLLAGRGHVACPGMSFGRVFHVTGEHDLAALPDHAVLVAERLPLTAAVLRILPTVAAIIVEHAQPADPVAAVARRFRIPTLLGIEGARRNLPPGELVTVDAEDGTVYSGYLQELLHHHFFRHEALAEEPEYRLLKITLQALGSPAATAPSEEPNPYLVVQRTYREALLRAVSDLATSRRGDRHPGSGLAVVSAAGIGEAPAPTEAGAPLETALEALTAEEETGGGMEGLVAAQEESVVAFLAGPVRMAVVEAFLAGDPVEDHVHLWWALRDGRTPGGAAAGPTIDEQAAALGMTVVSGRRGGSAWREGLAPARGRQVLAEACRIARHAVSERPHGGEKDPEREVEHGT